MTDTDNKKALVQEANIQYHTKLAETYDQTQPHFRQENVIQIRTRIEKFAKTTGGKRLLDMGCGTGFILSLAHSCFEEVYGIDITLAMLDIAASKLKEQKVNNVKLIRAPSDELPFPDSYLDVITTYSFLHHLHDLLPTFNYYLLGEMSIQCSYRPGYVLRDLSEKFIPSLKVLAK